VKITIAKAKRNPFFIDLPLLFHLIVTKFYFFSKVPERKEPKRSKSPMIFSAKQKEYIREAKSVWNFKIGSVRSGKTYLDTNYVIPANIRERAKKGDGVFILGVTESTIERNVLMPMRAIYGDKLVGYIKQHNEVELFGETCYAFGMEKETQLSKLQGASAKYVYRDEVAKWHQEAFLVLVSRLDKPYSRFDGSLNPESPYHYLKEFIDKDASIYRQHYRI
jgi:hypothetical protein